VKDPLTEWAETAVGWSCTCLNRPTNHTALRRRERIPPWRGSSKGTPACGEGERAPQRDRRTCSDNDDRLVLVPLPTPSTSFASASSSNVTAAVVASVCQMSARRRLARDRARSRCDSWSPPVAFDDGTLSGVMGLGRGAVVIVPVDAFAGTEAHRGGTCFPLAGVVAGRVVCGVFVADSHRLDGVLHRLLLAWRLPDTLRARAGSFCVGSSGSSAVDSTGPASHVDGGAVMRMVEEVVLVRGAGLAGGLPILRLDEWLDSDARSRLGASSCDDDTATLLVLVLGCDDGDEGGRVGVGLGSGGSLLQTGCVACGRGAAATAATATKATAAVVLPSVVLLL